MIVFKHEDAKMRSYTKTSHRLRRLAQIFSTSRIAAYLINICSYQNEISKNNLRKSAKSVEGLRASSGLRFFVLKRVPRRLA